MASLFAKSIFCRSVVNIYHIFEDHFKNLWIATYGGGINLMRNEWNGEKFINPNNQFKNYPLNFCSRTRFITEDKNGLMYVGTTSGMVIFRNANKNYANISFKIIRHDPKDKTSISGNDIHYVLPGKKDKLYVGTYGGGMCVSDKLLDMGTKPVFKSYSTKKGAFTNVFYTLKEDAQSNVWFSSQTIIGKFNPQTEVFETYKPQNKNSYNFSEATFCESQNWEMIYGTSTGFLSFDIKRSLKSNFKPRIIFSDLQLFNKSVEVGTEGSPLKAILDNTSVLELTSKQNNFTISFAALDYTNTTNIQYAYMLDGFEKEWNYVFNQRNATYTNIPKGTYTFRVKSTNADGLWVDNERTLIIERLPSFWESAWGYLFYFFIGVLLIGIAAFVLYKFFLLRTDIEVEHKLTNMKLKFFTDISHELRTLLTLIASPIDHILHNEELSETASSQLKLVQRNVDRLMKLITQLLDFRKIQNNKMKLYVEPVLVVELLNEITQNFEQIADEKDIDLKIVDKSAQAMLWVDKDKFEKIFFNLLSNAFKFTPQNKSITVFVNENDQFVFISVKDSGEGISKDKVRLLFERFESFINQKDLSQQGSGIGLALTKELVELHQAEITLESQVGIGSEFTVKFKKGKDHLLETQISEMKLNDSQEKVSDEIQDIESDLLLNEEPENLDKPLILVVEDNPELRDFLKTVLSLKFTVIEADNGVAALNLLQTEIPDLIVSDVMMPEMDGLELSKAVKADMRTSHIPIILLTARTDMDVKLEALQYGVDDYITKPFSSAYLEARVENILKLRKQLQELYLSSLTSGVKSTAAIKKNSQDEIFINRIISYIDENIQNSELTIEEIAAHLALGRSTFFKKLKSMIGISPVEFLRDYRIQKAAEFIESGEFNFTEISYLVGISDSSYFSRCFKQKFGVSPREYKEKCQNT